MIIFKAVKYNIYCLEYSNNYSFKKEQMGEINFNMLSYNISTVLAFQYVTNTKKSALEDFIHFQMLIFPNPVFILHFPINSG